MSHEEHYSEQGFWDKVLQYAKQIGGELLEKALTLYFTLQDPDTPAWAKTVIIGALGYLIFPVDAIPDFIPVAGYTDDAGVIAIAIGTIAVHIKPEHTQKAKEQVRRLLG